MLPRGLNVNDDKLAIGEALRGVLGNRGIRPFYFRGTREQKSKAEGNRGTKAILGNREHRK